MLKQQDIVYIISYYLWLKIRSKKDRDLLKRKDLSSFKDVETTTAFWIFHQGFSPCTNLSMLISVSLRLETGHLWQLGALRWARRAEEKVGCGIGFYKL